MPRKPRDKFLGDDSPIYFSRNSSPGNVVAGNAGRFYRKEIAGEGIYEGQLVNGRRHGKGRLLSSTGVVLYEGSWEDDQRSGYGIAKHDGGDCHEGNYYRDKRHGPGVFLWADGDKYSGNFDEGIIHGYGRYEWNNGNIYSGQWIKGRMTGEGLLCKFDGEQLHGQFLDGLLNGWGKKRWVDGTCYEGQFQEGLLCGYGRMLLPTDHSQFEGMWKDNLCAGIGRYLSSTEKKLGIVIQEESISYGQFPIWPATVGHLSVTWPLSAYSQLSEEDVDNQDEAIVKSLCYIGDVNDEDVNMGESLMNQIKSASMNQDNVNSSQSSAFTAELELTGKASFHSNIATSQARYGRIEFNIGLVYEGECRHYLPNGYGCLYNPHSFGNRTMSSNFAQPQMLMSQSEIEQFLHQIAEEELRFEDFSENMLLAAIDIEPDQFRDQIHRSLSIENILWRRGGRYVGRFCDGVIRFGEGCLTLGNGTVFDDI